MERPTTLLCTTVLLLAGQVATAGVSSSERDKMNQCDDYAQKFAVARDRWLGLSAAEQRKFPSLLSITVDAQNDWRRCLGLEPSQIPLRAHYKALVD